MRDPWEDPTHDDDLSSDLNRASDDFPFPEDMGEVNRLSGIGAVAGGVIGCLIATVIYFSVSDETLALFTFAKWHLFFTSTGLGAAAGGMLSMAINPKRFKEAVTSIFSSAIGPKHF